MATSTAIEAEAKKAPQLACSMVMLRAIETWITANRSLLVATRGQKNASHWWMNIISEAVAMVGPDNGMVIL